MSKQSCTKKLVNEVMETRFLCEDESLTSVMEAMHGMHVCGVECVRAHVCMCVSRTYSDSWWHLWLGRKRRPMHAISALSRATDLMNAWNSTYWSETCVEPELHFFNLFFPPFSFSFSLCASYLSLSLSV